ncbi:MAG: FadR/GntR family transcriptional regulator [Trueperaceae bacterium]
MVFTAMPSKKKSTFAAEQIIKAIAEGHYGIGDKLPTEAELGAQMGVSRTAIREAVSALRLGGILDSVPGAGTFVAKELSGIQIASSTLYATNDGSASAEAWEARSAIEDGVVALAVKQLKLGQGEKELEQLRASLFEMKKTASQEDYKGYIETNAALHINIARITGNGLLVSTIESLLSFIKVDLSARVNPAHLAEFLEESLAKHQAIVSALLARDEQWARKAMLEHFDELELYYASKFVT